MNLFLLHWKETFRAPQWEAKLSIKIVMALVMLYFIGAFVFGASVIYPILNKEVLDREPVEVFNGIVLYIFFFDAGYVFREKSDEAENFDLEDTTISE